MAYHKSEQCDMGAGCYEYGTCYAEAHGRPEMCPLRAKDCPEGDRAMIDLCATPDDMDKDAGRNQREPKMYDLSILCVTRAEKCVLPLLRLLPLAARLAGAEFVLVADGQEAFDTLAQNEVGHGRYDRLFKTETKGYIESVLDSCIDLTTGRWIFRIDDDESIPQPLVEWLRSGAYKESDHWKFNRAHLVWDKAGKHEWGEWEISVPTGPPLWPDHQTRLSTRDKSFGRTHIHCGSPHGGGDLCPYPILHHKFVIKSREEREEIMKQYESVQPGAGSGFRHFSVPELIEEEGGKLETISYDEFVQRGYTV